MDTLLEKALDVVGLGSFDDGSSEVPMPEMSDTVHLPPPSQAMKEARASLQERERKGLADLKEQLAEVEAEIATEQKIVDAGDFNLADMLAKGTPKSKLQKMRIDAELAAEIIEIKLNNAADIKAKLAMKRKELQFRSHRIMSWLQQTEVQTRAYQISMITGANRLHPEVFARAYKLLQALEREARDLFGEDLAKRVIQSITTNPVEPTLHLSLLAQMHPRDRKAIESKLETKTTKNGEKQ
jgi:hypothetical protein